MAEQNKIYKCSVCGNVVSVLEAHEGTLNCCGQDMNLLEEKTGPEEGNEKHVPVIEKTEKGLIVKVGDVPHPMEEKHHISLIQLLYNGEVIIGKRLKPGDKPEAEFCCLAQTEGMTARALCNLHGVWVSE